MYGSGERYGPRRHEVAFHDKQVFFGNGSSSHALGPRPQTHSFRSRRPTSTTRGPLSVHVPVRVSRISFVEAGAGAPALGSGGRAVAFAPGLNPAPMAAFPVPRSPNPACSFPAPGSPLGSCTSHTGSVGPTVAGRVAAQGATAESCTAPGLATAAASPAIEPVDASMDRFRTTDTRRPETALHFSM